MPNSVIIAKEVAWNSPPSVQPERIETQNNSQQRWEFPGFIVSLRFTAVILRLTFTSVNDAAVVFSGKALIKLSQFVELLEQKPSCTVTCETVASATEAAERRSTKEYWKETIDDGDCHWIVCWRKQSILGQYLVSFLSFYTAST